MSNDRAEDVLRAGLERSREHSSGFRNFHFHWLAAGGRGRVSGTDNQDTVCQPETKLNQYKSCEICKILISLGGELRAKTKQRQVTTNAEGRDTGDLGCKL